MCRRIGLRASTSLRSRMAAKIASCSSNTPTSPPAGPSNDRPCSFMPTLMWSFSACIADRKKSVFAGSAMAMWKASRHPRGGHGRGSYRASIRARCRSRRARCRCAAWRRRRRSPARLRGGIRSSAARRRWCRQVRRPVLFALFGLVAADEGAGPLPREHPPIVTQPSQRLADQGARNAVERGEIVFSRQACVRRIFRRSGRAAGDARCTSGEGGAPGSAGETG